MKIPGLGIGAGEKELPWKATEVPGVHWLPLHLEPSPKGEAEASQAKRPAATVLIRMAPGSSYGAHRHLGAEEVLVLQGGYADELGEYHQGEHVHYAPGSTHRPVALGRLGEPEGPNHPACILFAVALAGIELLERDET